MPPPVGPAVPDLPDRDERGSIPRRELLDLYENLQAVVETARRIATLVFSIILRATGAQPLQPQPPQPDGQV